MSSKRKYKRVKKDYQRQKLQNPFFQHKKKGKSRRFTRCLILAIFVLILFLVWFFFGAKFWRINNLKITGLTRVDSAELEQIVWQQTGKKQVVIFHESNIFLFDQETATEKIMAVYNLAGVVINKKLPHTLEIKVNERPYAFIFQEGGSFFHASADGYVIKEPAVREEDKSKYFILENKSTTSFLGDKDKLNIKKEYLDFILDLGNQISGQSELTLETIIIDQELNMATVKFKAGPAVYFSAKDDQRTQLERLLLVKREKIKDNFSKTNYIDLRYGDKIFINPDFK